MFKRSRIGCTIAYTIAEEMLADMSTSVLLIALHVTVVM